MCPLSSSLLGALVSGDVGGSSVSCVVRLARSAAEVEAWLRRVPRRRVGRVLRGRADLFARVEAVVRRGVVANVPPPRFVGEIAAAG